MAYDYPCIRFVGEYPQYQIRLRHSELVVGRVRYDELDSEVCIYTILPYAVPKNRIKVVGEFLQKLNEDEEYMDMAWGHYYVNPNSGECGFVRRLTSARQLRGNPPLCLTASQHLQWHWDDYSSALYVLHPEIKGLIFASRTLAQCLNSVKQSPPRSRKKVKISEIKLK